MESLSYNLPEENIAHHPSEARGGSRLMHFQNGICNDDIFSSLPDLIDPKYSLILNETKVVNARMILSKATGGLIEVFCLEPAKGDITIGLTKKGEVEWNCFVGKAKKWKEGIISATTEFQNESLIFSAEKLSQNAGVFTLKFSWNIKELSFAEILEIFGKVPLPPYITRQTIDSDKERYQTVFASNPGSVAAPTASLHFTDEILSQIQRNGSGLVKVNLHVGAGTFKPLSSSVEEHEMHAEMFEVHKPELEKLRDKKDFIAVGTTAVRTVESLFILANNLKTAESIDFNQPQVVLQWDWKNQINHFENHQEAFGFLLEVMNEKEANTVFGHTSLMIIPGFKFQVIAGLITNFHMPNSSLLLLVSAFVGDQWRSIYELALNNGYRFLSYGDSSLLIP